MTSSRRPERVVWALYRVPTIRPVTSSMKGSYCYRCPAFHSTNCSLASSESFLYQIYKFPGGFNHSNAELDTFLNASGAHSHWSLSSWTIYTSRNSEYRDCADMEVNWVATTRFRNVDVKESSDGRLPNGFLDGHWRGSSSECNLSSYWVLPLSGFVLKLSSRSSSRINHWCLLVQTDREW